MGYLGNELPIDPISGTFDQYSWVGYSEVGVGLEGSKAVFVTPSWDHVSGAVCLNTKLWGT